MPQLVLENKDSHSFCPIECDEQSWRSVAHAKEQNRHKVTLILKNKKRIEVETRYIHLSMMMARISYYARKAHNTL